MKPQKPAPEIKPPSADDVFCTELREQCARSIVAYLKRLNTDRAIKSLTLPEMLGMAEACTSRWIVLVSQRIAAGTAPREYQNLLMGA